jgi:carbon monoxide dehydrogenase subunit G
VLWWCNEHRNRYREDHRMVDNDARSEVIHASPDVIVKALTDFESYPEWQTGVIATTVHARDDAGRGTDIEIYVDAKVTKVRYRARYFYDLDHGRLGWNYLGGDLAECAGRYELTPVGAGTRVSIDIVTEVGFYIPGPIKKLIRDQALKNSMRDLKKRVGG